MAVTDYSGCSMVSDEVADYFVYIAENGKVFHRDRECTYLRIRIQESTPYVLENKRNQSGGIYYPCESCCHAEAQPSAAMVYFTSYGDRYHIRKECSKLKRNVRAVRRSKAGNLSPCSKCGGGE
jgi:predicted SprT family Zn-dependent metalloprotease